MICMALPPDNVDECIMFLGWAVCLSVNPYDIVTVNGLNSFDKTIFPTDDLINEEKL